MAVDTEWSQHAVRIPDAPWETLGRRSVMIPLTYPAEWEVWCPDARTLHKHRETLRSLLEHRHGTPIDVWVTEFKTRAAPHLHVCLMLLLPEDEQVG